MKPQALILRTAGTNCDVETAHAFELAGATSAFLHINRLLEDPRQLQEYQLLAIPGGFSYGDDISAGRIFANQITHHLREPLHEFVAAAKPVIGICNGFQVLIKTDLLPGAVGGKEGQTCTLTNNDCGRFVDRWVHLAARSKKCIWTSNLGEERRGQGTGVRGQDSSSERPSVLAPDPSPLTPVIELPIAHGEGKFVPADESVRQGLWDSDQVALIYARADGSPAKGEFPDNPNGSIDDIAGVCDSTGLVFGLMPHPERHLSPLQHPAWTRRANLTGDGQGLKIFRNAVQHAMQAVGAGV